MNVAEILDILNTIAPFNIAEKWDNCGLQAGDPASEIRGIMVGLDVTIELMEAAKKSNFDMVLTHHPLMIAPEKTFDFQKMPGKAIQMAAQNNISIVSLHTNLDKAHEGLNDFFASKIGLSPTEVFVSHSEAEPDQPVTGIGRMGHLEKAVTLEALAAQIKQQLELGSLRVVGSMDLMVETLAVCTGSGGSLVEEFIASDAQVYVTGDIKYHEARSVEEASKALIDVGHFGSEHMAIELLLNRLKPAFNAVGADIKIEPFLKEKDPFTII